VVRNGGKRTMAHKVKYPEFDRLAKEYTNITGSEESK
jgi:hypothetical protein